jgi:ElaB/YqjD/DUF883 family membrane-anchored ribosome-binding protein
MAKKKAIRKTVSKQVNDIATLAKDAQAQLEHARTQWTRAEKEVNAYVKKNPRKAALMAAGIGAAIGAAAALTIKRKK